MARLIGVVLVVATLLTVGGCGGGGDDEEVPDIDVTEAAARLEQILRDTAAAAAPDTPFVERDPIGRPQDCVDSLNRSKGLVYRAVYGEVATPKGEEADLLPAVQRHWEAEGYDIDDSFLDDVQPELKASVDGFHFRALAVPDTGVVDLTGTTPCVRPADAGE